MVRHYGVTMLISGITAKRERVGCCRYVCCMVERELELNLLSYDHRIKQAPLFNFPRFYGKNQMVFHFPAKPPPLISNYEPIFPFK